MKYFIKTILSVSVLIALFHWSCGSNPASPTANNPTSPAAPVTSTQVLCKNGAMGSWFGNLFIGSIVGYPATDNVTGDTHVLALNFPASYPITQTIGDFEFTATAAADPSNYYPSGHMQFDLMLGSIASLYNYITVADGNGNTNTNQVSLNLASLNNSNFTHVSIALSSFPVSGGVNAPVSTPFFMSISMVAPTAGTVALINDVKWTYN